MTSKLWCWSFPLQREVHEHAMHMLGCETKNNPLPPPPDPSEIAEFILAKWGGPTINNFRLEFAKTHLTPWNKKAAKVFARSFIKSGEYTSGDKHTIKTSFWAHLKTLCSHYHEQVRGVHSLPPPQQMIDNCQAAARRAHCKTVCKNIFAH